jgi:hypothetical protein
MSFSLNDPPGTAIWAQQRSRRAASVRRRRGRRHKNRESPDCNACRFLERRVNGLIGIPPAGIAAELIGGAAFPTENTLLAAMYIMFLFGTILGVVGARDRRLDRAGSLSNGRIPLRDRPHRGLLEIRPPGARADEGTRRQPSSLAKTPLVVPPLIRCL